LPQTAQAYAADWISEGYLVRRFPPGAHEECYELSGPAAASIRFIAGLEAPRSVATQSRLAVVIQQIVSLAEETETDTARRLESLLAERNRVDPRSPMSAMAAWRSCPIPPPLSASAK
jgi:hypothetical protein